MRTFPLQRSAHDHDDAGTVFDRSYRQQWAILQPLIPPAKHGGRPRDVEMREVLNTLFYLNRTGCQWDLLPTICCRRVRSTSIFGSGAMMARGRE